MLFWVFFRHHLHRPTDIYIVAGDDVIVTQAGQHTHGLDRFFSSLEGKPGPGLAFLTLSLVSVQQRRSFPRRIEQVIRSDAEQAASKAKAAAKKPQAPCAKRRPGRPKGSKNKPKADGPYTPECARSDAALYFPYTGPYAGRGPHRKYGPKVDYAPLPGQDLQETTVEGHIQTCLYQAQWLHQECPQPLNVVSLVKTTLRPHARAPVVLCSSALALAYAPLVDYYGLRFQIELNFRDAQQAWGLADFMNVTPPGVTNAANLALCMVNVAHPLRRDLHPPAPDYSVLALQADCRASQYVEETIKMLPDKPEPVLLRQIFPQVAGLGRIHASPPSFGCL